MQLPLRMDLSSLWTPPSCARSRCEANPRFRWSPNTHCDWASPWRYWVHGLSRIRLCLVASIECPVGDSAKTRQFASSDMLVNLMIQPVSSCCLRFQWYRLPALSLERLPVESSVYMGNGWFGYAVMLWVITVTTYVCLQPVLVESSVHMGNG